MPMNYSEGSRILAHTVRMLTALSARPDHPRKDEYASQLARYRGAWDQVDPLNRDDCATVAAQTIHDLTPELVAAARAALEA